MMKFFGILLAAAFFVACTEPQAEQSTEVLKLSPDQLKEVVDGKKPFFFLDVRSAEEIAELGTLTGYTHIPIDELEGRLGEIPKDIPIITA